MGGSKRKSRHVKRGNKEGVLINYKRLKDDKALIIVEAEEKNNDKLINVTSRTMISEPQFEHSYKILVLVTSLRRTSKV